MAHDPHAVALGRKAGAKRKALPPEERSEITRLGWTKRRAAQIAESQETLKAKKAEAK